MSVPYRYELDPKSCVNNEVKVYNRKLEKYLKVCENSRIITVDSHRELFIRHGLHMNTRGKEQIARRITQIIKVILSEKKNDPIIMKDREDQGINSEETEKIVTHRMKIRKPRQTKKSKQVGIKIKKMKNYPQSEPENHQLHDTKIFYGWTKT
jgi:hypothetical protein